MKFHGECRVTFEIWLCVCWIYGKDGIGRIILGGQERKRHEQGNQRSNVGKKGGSVWENDSQGKDWDRL